MGQPRAGARCSGLMFRGESAPGESGNAWSTSTMPEPPHRTAQPVSAREGGQRRRKEGRARWTCSGERMSERSIERYPKPEQRSTTVIRPRPHALGVAAMCSCSSPNIGNASAAISCKDGQTPVTKF
eukprot:3934638-Rhodomonas_salina.1